MQFTHDATTTMSLPTAEYGQIRIETTKNPLLTHTTTSEHASLLFGILTTLLTSETSRLGIGKKQQPLSAKKNGDSSGPAAAASSVNQASSAKNDADPSRIQWSRLPGRFYLRQIAAAHQDGTPKYVHGQLLVRDFGEERTCRIALVRCPGIAIGVEFPSMEETTRTTANPHQQEEDCIAKVIMDIPPGDTS